MLLAAATPPTEKKPLAHEPGTENVALVRSSVHQTAP